MTKYNKDDTIKYNGKGYICQKPTDKLPNTDTPYDWQMVEPRHFTSFNFKEIKE